MQHPTRVVRFIVVILAGVLLLPALVVARPAAVLTQTESDAAAEFAYGLSGLERDANYDQLYRLMHPDAKAVVPKSAVVGWYRKEFAPQNPQAITEIIAVRQVTWTWPVTGETYATTYEVDFVQPFGVGPAYTYASETVRLVPTGNSFGWFFGRSREFVDEQIARYGTGNSPSSTISNTSQPSASGDMVELLLSEPFLPSELPPGYEVTSGSVTEAGRMDGPVFGILREDLEATWLKVEVTAAPDVGIYSTHVMMQFAVFPTEEDAQRALHGDQIRGLLERNVLGSSYTHSGFYTETSHVLAYLWSERHVSPPQDNPPRLGAGYVAAGTIALSGNVLVFTHVHVSTIIISVIPPFDLSQAESPALDLTRGAVLYVERLAGQ